MGTRFIEKNLLKRAIPSKHGRIWIYQKIKKHTPKILILSFLGALGSIFSVIFALISKNLVNISISGDRDAFFKAVLFFAVFIVLQISIGTFAYHLQEKLLYTSDNDVKKSVFHDILTSDYSIISQKHSVDLLHRINSDVSTVTSSIISIITSLASFVTSLVAASLVLFSMAPIFTVCIIPLCILLAFASIYLQRDMKTMQKDVSRSSAKLSSFFQETIEKLLIVQGLGIANEIEAKSDILIAEKISNQQKRKNLQVKVNLATTLLTTTGAFVTLIWCAYKVLTGVIDYGTLVAITSLVSQLQEPLLALPLTIPTCITLTASTERLLEVIDASKQDDIKCIDKDNVYPNIQSICAKNLSFSYPNQEDDLPIINNVSLSLDINSMTVLTGSSGCGKSTILKLLLGLYSSESGELFIELTDGSKIPINRTTRNLFAFAPQGNLILSGTIRENIMISNPHATEEDLLQAIYVSAMEEYIKELPQGLDTILGENGAGLSEGQVQRINIARAVISGAPILLLDEVTSSLDMETEKKVLLRIHDLPGKTCIAVTHRPAALEIAEHQIHFSEGKAERMK